MDTIGSTAKAKVIARMTAPVGLNAFLAALSDGSSADFTRAESANKTLPRNWSSGRIRCSIRRCTCIAKKWSIA